MINSLPYNSIDALYKPSSNKIFYLSEHFLKTTDVDNLKLFNLSSFNDYRFNIKLTSKGIFATNSNKRTSFNKMHFADSKLETRSGYKIEYIDSIIYSDMNQSLHGIFSAEIPDQAIKGSISYDQDKVLSARSDISIRMNSLISSNQYFDINGDELFSALLKVGNGKTSIQLKSNLKRTYIASPIKEIQKTLGSSLMTSIYIDDLSKPSYLIGNKEYDIFIDSNKSGYFILGNYFGDMQVSNKKKDGFYVYLDLDEIKMEDYSFSNSTENTISTIKAVKIKTQIFNIFSNNYNCLLYTSPSPRD